MATVRTTYCLSYFQIRNRMACTGTYASHIWSVGLRCLSKFFTWQWYRVHYMTKKNFSCLITWMDKISLTWCCSLETAKDLNMILTSIMHYLNWIARTSLKRRKEWRKVEVKKRQYVLAWVWHRSLPSSVDWLLAFLMSLIYPDNHSASHQLQEIFIYSRIGWIVLIAPAVNK